jgi:hypothetical protein
LKMANRHLSWAQLGQRFRISRGAAESGFRRHERRVYPQRHIEFHFLSPSETARLSGLFRELSKSRGADGFSEWLEVTPPITVEPFAGTKIFVRLRGLGSDLDVRIEAADS